jgi:hypothetical protein
MRSSGKKALRRTAEDCVRTSLSISELQGVRGENFLRLRLHGRLATANTTRPGSLNISKNHHPKVVYHLKL